MKHALLILTASLGLIAMAACKQPQGIIADNTLATSGDALSRGSQVWPTWPAAKQVITFFEPADFAQGVLVRTLAGLTAYVAGQEQQAATSEYLWLGGVTDPSLQNTMSRTHGTAAAWSGDLWSLVTHFKDSGVVRGYILYHEDPNQNGGTDFSVNIATSLCAPLHGIAVSDSIEANVKTIGLPLLADARQMDYPTLINSYGSLLNRNMLAAMATRRATMRDLAVAAGILMTTDVPGGWYVEGLANTKVGGVVVGWTAGGEWTYAHEASSYGLTIVASDWTTNLAIEGSGVTGARYPLHPRVYAAADEQDDGVSHYVAFVLSDGDNLCFSGNGLSGSYWYDSPMRGAIPFGWGLTTLSILQARPDMFDRFYETATGLDDFVTYADYFYVESFGLARGGMAGLDTVMATRLPATRTANIHSLVAFSNNWLDPNAVAAYQEIATDSPDMDGLFVMYAAGNGNMLWAPRPNGAPMPVLSPRYTLDQTPDTTASGSPQNAATVLGEWGKQAANKPGDRFAWVAVSAWAKFQAPADASDLQDGQGMLGSYEAAVYATRKLPPNVKVVTPSALLHMLNNARNAPPNYPTAIASPASVIIPGF